MRFLGAKPTKVRGSTKTGPPIVPHSSASPLQQQVSLLPFMCLYQQTAPVTSAAGNLISVTILCIHIFLDFRVCLLCDLKSLMGPRKSLIFSLLGCLFVCFTVKWETVNLLNMLNSIQKPSSKPLTS